MMDEQNKGLLQVGGAEAASIAYLLFHFGCFHSSLDFPFRISAGSEVKNLLNRSP